MLRLTPHFGQFRGTTVSQRRNLLPSMDLQDSWKEIDRRKFESRALSDQSNKKKRHRC